MNTRTLKLLQDVREVSYLPHRHVLPKPAALYLMRLRSELADATLKPRRMVIPVLVKGEDEIHAQPVKITHV